MKLIHSILKLPASRIFQVTVLAVFLTFALGASETGARYNNLSHRLMCTCGCSELLGECSHVGCQQSESLGRELKISIQANKTDQEILAAFSDEYGPTILAAPTTSGFNLVIWIVPFALLALGILGIIVFIRRSAHKQALAGVSSTVTSEQTVLDPALEAMRERIRRETEGEER